MPIEPGEWLGRETGHSHRITPTFFMNRISAIRKRPKAGMLPRLLPLIALAALIFGSAALFLFARALLQSNPPPVIENAQAGIIKIEVEKEGLYLLTLDSLLEAGLDLETLDDTNLHLSRDGRTIAYHLENEELIFYGQASDSRYSRYGTYLLETGRSGERMPTILASGPDNPVATLPQRLHLEQNTLYDGRARYENAAQNEKQGPWYWDTLQVQSQLPLSFELPQISPEEPALIQMTLWGATHDAAVENDHDFDVVLNEETIGTVRWDGETHYESETAVPAELLQSGQNQLVLDNTVEGAALVDIMRLDWIEVIYHIPPAAQNDRLAIRDVDGTVSATGFSNQPLLFDVSDPEKPGLLSDWTYEDETAVIPVQQSQHLIAAGPDGYLEPVAISGLRANNWSSPENQADMLIITTEQLAPALIPLVEARQAQGLTAVVVPIEEIYDSFGFGRPSPQSITEFARYAVENWTEPKPAYLFLVGEATYDYRGYLGDGPHNLVPSLMIPVSYSGETVSDTRLADIDGDFRPDLAVGRWPVDSPEAVSALIERTLAYENGQAVGRIIFTADGTSTEFSGVSDRVLESSNLDQETAEKLYGATAAELTTAWNQGAWLVNYTGHGSLDRWGQQDVFSAEAVSGLHSSGPPPIVMQLTCLTGFFAHPTLTSLSEQMLLHENGPVLIISATSLTLSSSQTPFGINLANELQNPETIRIGDAVTNAKLALEVNDSSLREISDTFGLLGDPSALIVRP
jgi:hypothetical protein